MAKTKPRGPLAHLTENDRRTLAELVAAFTVIIYDQLTSVAETPEGKEALRGILQDAGWMFQKLGEGRPKEPIFDTATRLAVRAANRVQATADDDGGEKQEGAGVPPPRSEKP